MIKHIFFDLDETLAHTDIVEPDQSCLNIVLAEGVYYTIVRPQAKTVIEFARDMVGKKNVHILTAAMFHYAMEVNVMAEFGFNPENIHSAEHMKDHLCYGAYGDSFVIPNTKIADKTNVLIDNLYPEYNRRKLDYIGGRVKNYLKVDDYYGVNYPDCTFEKDVKLFLETKHNEENE